jgi:hypothetical protein
MPVLHKFQTFRRSGHRLHFTRVHYFGEPQVLYVDKRTASPYENEPDTLR